MILGVGVDVVSIAAFAEQLEQPGSRFSRVFTARERRAASGRAAQHAVKPEPSDAWAHLAARWAAKEAFIKAWSGSLYGTPPLLPEAIWDRIEVIQDQCGRPALEIHGDVAKAVEETCGAVRMHLSLSHDGDIATAFVVLEGVSGQGGL